MSDINLYDDAIAFLGWMKNAEQYSHEVYQQYLSKGAERFSEKFKDSEPKQKIAGQMLALAEDIHNYKKEKMNE